MAKLKGPLFSVSARGKFAKVMYYARNFMGAYCTALAKKGDRKSASQLAQRAIIKDAVISWQVNEQKLQTVWERIRNSKGFEGYPFFLEQYINGILSGLINPEAPRVKYYRSLIFDRAAFAE
jgi:hypothetical protein